MPPGFDDGVAVPMWYSGGEAEELGFIMAGEPPMPPIIAALVLKPNDGGKLEAGVWFCIPIPIPVEKAAMPCG